MNRHRGTKTETKSKRQSNRQSNRQTVRRRGYLTQRQMVGLCFEPVQPSFIIFPVNIYDVLCWVFADPLTAN
jgi:hypothetical protein